MRATTFAISRALAVILAFVLGFLSFAGVLFGVGYYVYTKVSIDSLDSLGINIDTDKVIDSESAEVALTAKTIQQLVDEIKTVVDESETFSINTLISRYGLKIPDPFYEYVPNSVRDLPLATVFSGQGVDTILSLVYVGNLLKYEQAEGGWIDGDGVLVSGIYATLADYTLHELVNGGFDADKLTSELTVAEIFEIEKRENLPVYILDGETLTPVTDLEEPVDVWCDANGTPSDAIINAIAGYSISDIETELDTLRVADITSLVSYSDAWYEWKYIVGETESYIQLTKSNDVTTELAHVTLAQISGGELQEEIEGVEINAFMGYTYDEENGVWLNKSGDTVTGIMGAIAEYKFGELDTCIGEVKLGEISGFIAVETLDENGNTVVTWYESYNEENPDECIVASGILGKLADLSVDEMTNEQTLADKVETLTVADALNYEVLPNENWQEGDAEYKMYTYIKNGNAVTGVMAVIAGAELGNIQATIDTALMGDILGYEFRTGNNGKPTYAEDGITVLGYNDWWFDESGKPIHALMNSVSMRTFDQLGNLPSELTVGEIIPAEQRQSGYIKLVPEDTTVENISTVVNDVFTETTVYDFVKAGAISLDDMTDEQKALFDTPDSHFGKLTLSGLIVEAIVLYQKVEYYESLLQNQGN